MVEAQPSRRDTHMKRPAEPQPDGGDAQRDNDDTAGSNHKRHRQRGPPPAKRITDGDRDASGGYRQRCRADSLDERGTVPQQAIEKRRSWREARLIDRETAKVQRPIARRQGNDLPHDRSRLFPGRRIDQMVNAKRLEIDRDKRSGGDSHHGERTACRRSSSRSKHRRQANGPERYAVDQVSLADQNGAVWKDRDEQYIQRDDGDAHRRDESGARLESSCDETG